MQINGAKQNAVKQALIIIDVQRDFCPGGTLAVSDDISFLPKINALIAKSACVILTQDWHTENHISFAESHAGKKPQDKITAPYGEQILWPRHCVSGTKGADFHPDLRIDTARLIMRKGAQADCDSYSAFFDAAGRPTGLGGYLRDAGCEKLLFCGLTTDFCVSFSALDATRLGFQTRIALAACRAADINGSYKRALSAMKQAGVELSLFE